MRISFCITCKGRRHHVEQTLPKNLATAKGIDDIEFILLDYNSPDGLSDWVRKFMGAHLESGRLVYYRERTAPNFSFPHAENVAHVLATGDLLCTLHADHFLPAGYCEKLRVAFRQESENIFVGHGHAEVGGMMTFRRRDYLELRGYDEEMKFGWGHMDTDLMERAIHVQKLKRVVWGVPPGSWISHGNGERHKYAIRSDLDRHQVAKLHRTIRDGREKGARINPKGIGRATIYRNLSETPIISGID
jgi:glycosyltransferase involved in cell wall biosynthesis